MACVWHENRKGKLFEGGTGASKDRVGGGNLCRTLGIMGMQSLAFCLPCARLWSCL